jgi:hypothetical protein
MRVIDKDYFPPNKNFPACYQFTLAVGSSEETAKCVSPQEYDRYYVGDVYP